VQQPDSYPAKLCKGQCWYLTARAEALLPPKGASSCILLPNEGLWLFNVFC